MMSITLCQVIELYDVLVHIVGPLLQIQELLQVAVHDFCWKVVHVEHFVELIPRHLVIALNSRSICGPSSTCETTYLLCCKQSLLELRIVK
jgi:hypothetical protein